jgi:polysaccharide pyruvyl transferase WcaK-like protein
MPNNICVLGHYNKGNTGDQLFQPAFRELFPEVNFTFTDTITAEMVRDDHYSAFFIGGGSLLDGEPNISAPIELLKTKPIFYIGVGAETYINAKHKKLLEVAKLVAIRNADTKILSDRIENKNIISIPDLVYSLKTESNSTKRNNKLLFIPNFLVIPKHYDPYWRINAWERAKFSIAEALDRICGEYVNGIHFFSMCHSDDVPDKHAAIEITNSMRFGDTAKYVSPSGDAKQDIQFISQYSAVITQRYHGIILSELSNTPHIVIHHHDKLKMHSPRNGEYVDYYAISKHKIIDAFETIWNKPYQNQPINSNSFKELVERVNNFIL